MKKLFLILFLFCVAQGEAQSIFKGQSLISFDGFLNYRNNKVFGFKTLSTNEEFSYAYAFNPYVALGASISHSFLANYSILSSGPGIGRGNQKQNQISLGPMLRIYYLNLNKVAGFVEMGYRPGLSTFVENSGSKFRSDVFIHAVHPKIGFSYLPASRFSLDFSAGYLMTASENAPLKENGRLVMELGFTFYLKSKVSKEN